MYVLCFVVHRFDCVLVAVGGGVGWRRLVARHAGPVVLLWTSRDGMAAVCWSGGTDGSDAFCGHLHRVLAVRVVFHGGWVCVQLFLVCFYRHLLSTSS